MNLKNIYIILGPPGSGKGTQSKLLGEKLGYAYFSTGALLRDLAKENSEFGRKVKNYIEQGIIIPDEMMHDVFRAKVESLGKITGLILDGFPRTLGQIKILDQLVAEFGNPKVKAVFLEVDKQKLLGRLQGRKSCPNCHAMYKSDMPEYSSNICSRCGGKLEIRADDDPVVMEKRFEEYLAKTAPVKEHYEKLGVLIHINGDQPIEAVHKEITTKLQ